jgi:hypothetical protein
LKKAKKTFLKKLYKKFKKKQLGLGLLVQLLVIKNSKKLAIGNGKQTLKNIVMRP